MAENNVELSEKAVAGYLVWGLDKVNHYTWELAKLGTGLWASGFGLGKGYEYVVGLPIIGEVDRLAHQVQYLPEVAGGAAVLFAGWRAKQHVDSWLEKHA